MKIAAGDLIINEIGGAVFLNLALQKSNIVNGMRCVAKTCARSDLRFVDLQLDYLVRGEISKCQLDSK